MLELAAYFTGAQLQPKHMIISLRTAMTACYKHRNLQSAQTFARRLLELAPPGQAATLARQIQQVAERNPRDEIQLDYDQVCSGTWIDLVPSFTIALLWQCTDDLFFLLSVLVQRICGMRYLVHTHLQRISQCAMPILPSTF